MVKRAILHIDMDAFYASVEQRDNPDLKGQAVIVGGTGNRGVVAAASYEARRHGVFSAMPVARARRLCPDGVYIRPRMSAYQQASQQVFAIFHRFTPEVEALSLDEAFLDVSASQALHGNAIQIGRQIKHSILDEVELVASVGLAPNKFVAKLASDHNKPDGFCVVRANQLRQFLDPLPVKRIWGIGKKSLPNLQRLGINTIADLRQADRARLSPVLGNRVEHLQRLARGEDDRAVESAREDKSISSEVTLDEDLQTLPACQKVIQRLADQVASRVRARELSGRTLTTKIRTSDFRTFTRSHSLADGTADSRVIIDIALGLMATWWREAGPQPVRLLGVGLSNFVTSQTDLFGAQSSSEIVHLTDRLRQKFGDQALTMAALLPEPATDGDDLECREDHNEGGDEFDDVD